VLFQRIYLAFDISTIPSNATIIMANLTIHHKSTFGNPFGTLGNMFLERVNNNSFGAPALPCTGCPHGLFGVNIEEEVSAHLQADLAASYSTAQFRMRFYDDYLDNNKDDGLVYTNAHTLTVTYQAP
jgi:hypothetical protein